MCLPRPLMIRSTKTHLNPRCKQGLKTDLHNLHTSCLTLTYCCVINSPVPCHSPFPLFHLFIKPPPLYFWTQENAQQKPPKFFFESVGIFRTPAERRRGMFVQRGSRGFEIGEFVGVVRPRRVRESGEPLLRTTLAGAKWHDFSCELFRFVTKAGNLSPSRPRGLSSCRSRRVGQQTQL